MIDFREREYQEFIDYIASNSDFYLFEVPAKDINGEIKMMKFVNRIDITVIESAPTLFKGYEDNNILSHFYQRG